MHEDGAEDSACASGDGPGGRLIVTDASAFICVIVCARICPLRISLYVFMHVNVCMCMCVYVWVFRFFVQLNGYVGSHRLGP
jgi:hypothetical protein